MADKIVEGIEFDTAHCHALGVELEQLSPDFLLGGSQAYDDNAIEFHEYLDCSSSVGYRLASVRCAEGSCSLGWWAGSPVRLTRALPLRSEENTLLQAKELAQPLSAQHPRGVGDVAKSIERSCS